MRKRPASKNWNLFLLRQRVKVDISQNGFGLGELQPPYEKTGEQDENSSGNVSENENGRTDAISPSDAMVSCYIHLYYLIFECIYEPE